MEQIQLEYGLFKETITAIQKQKNMNSIVRSLDGDTEILWQLRESCKATH